MLHLLESWLKSKVATLLSSNAVVAPSYAIVMQAEKATIRILVIVVAF
jgi:hypothetical protein